MAKAKKQAVETPPQVNDQITDSVTQTQEEPVSKSIFTSKTIWVNLLAIIAWLVQKQFGFVIDESIQMEILGFINILLRMITKEPVTWGK